MGFWHIYMALHGADVVAADVVTPVHTHIFQLVGTSQRVYAVVGTSQRIHTISGTQP